jgi:outer membrane protein assembly factor BamB
MMRPNLHPLGLLCSVGIGLLPFNVSASNWPQWRGPALNGSTDEKGFLSQWSLEQGVRWKTPLPGFSGSTPAVWGERIFVSSPNSDKELLLLCLNKSDGKVLWQKVLATGDTTKGKTSPNMASPSPVTDGHAVYALYGTGDFTALDFDGNQLWTRNLAEEFGRFANMWLYGSSPLLFEGRLYLQVLQRTPVPPDYTSALDGKTERESFLLCVDAKTGKTLWRALRPTDAGMESKESYATPMPLVVNEHKELVIVGGDYLTGHSLEDGAELWRCGGFNPKKGDWMRIVSSPVVFKDLAIAAGPKRVPVIAVRSGGTGDVTETRTAWKFDEFPPDVCTPVIYGETLHVLDGDKQMLTALNPETGEKKWQVSLGLRENFKASPTAADGRIYCISERGTVVVVDASSGTVVLTAPMGGGSPTRSSVVLSGGDILLRTAEEMICVGK